MLNNSRISHLDKIWQRTSLFAVGLTVVGLVFAWLARTESTPDSLLLFVGFVAAAIFVQLRALRTMILATIDYVDQKTASGAE